jgi:hypothetical protein
VELSVLLALFSLTLNNPVGSHGHRNTHRFGPGLRSATNDRFKGFRYCRTKDIVALANNEQLTVLLVYGPINDGVMRTMRSELGIARLRQVVVLRRTGAKRFGRTNGRWTADASYAPAFPTGGSCGAVMCPDEGIVRTARAGGMASAGPIIPTIGEGA